MPEAFVKGREHRTNKVGAMSLLLLGRCRILLGIVARGSAVDDLAALISNALLLQVSFSERCPHAPPSATVPIAQLQVSI